MTDDPEITDPRDPHRRRDIVMEVDRWLALPASLREATVSHAMLQAARDEIMALRALLDRHDRLVIKAVAVATPAIRNEALEEAARLCERVPGDPQHGDFFAKAIRALRDRAPP